MLLRLIIQQLLSGVVGVMKTDLPKVSIKKGREWHVSRGHPWLFSGGISQAPKKVEAGDLVTLLDYEGRFVANGYFNANCDIAVRVMSRDPSEKIDTDYFVSVIKSAWQLRQRCFDFSLTNVFRLINAEGDMLPGFIVDYYAGIFVVQCHTAGADKLLPFLIEGIEKTIAPTAIVVRNDVSARLREGLVLEEPRVVSGNLPHEILVKENGHVFNVDMIHGQKTGYFTDQRDKRLALAAYSKGLPDGSKFLNCFSYTCSFSIYVSSTNQRIKTVNVDQSAFALEQGKRNFQLNSLTTENHEFIENDAFAFLDRQASLNERYEMVLLDPPAFAKTNKDKQKALKGYARLNGMGLRLTKPGGILALCSCSGAVSMSEFLDCVRDSVGASGRATQILETFQHGLDHPINMMAPECAYLKVVFIRVLDG